jgi:hypothetical protein
MAICISKSSKQQHAAASAVARQQHGSNTAARQHGSSIARQHGSSIARQHSSVPAAARQSSSTAVSGTPVRQPGMGMFGFGPQFAQLEGVARRPAFGRMGY